MSLTDVMSSAGLTGWAEVGLVISLAAFAAIVVRVALFPRAEIERAARQVLEPDDAPGASGAPGAAGPDATQETTRSRNARP